MVTKMDKRARSQLFRTRLLAAMAERRVSQSALARSAGVDRSTISQLLKDEARLPNAHVAAQCASVLGVSADWLLGLSQRPEQAADLVALAMTMTEAPRALVDERIFDWHREAEGYKIRHVPAGLPDMLKTNEMLHWEYSAGLGRTAEQAIGASMDRLNWMRQAQSDYEICLPLHELRAFARAEGYYAGIPRTIRETQLSHMVRLLDQLYPSLRIYLFDAHRLYSAPITVFGPLLSVIYLGSNYLVFRDTERVRALTRHFDKLVREADVTDRALPGHIAGLRATMVQ
ncbi:helix-turn-helix domain-containing protein [Pelagovum pacificum]|uniref:Helix-turn-helix transcriptional regulator n=1 Tax=Pelagovum pacificum TaxID=2588711 RepID=A0A5C5GH01_9RHOB|nr:helix-turn-helix transcriptional regulator [Pelagovum pacificum]QQA43644.1 helix-turn-helix transcriptional regulator [Pelagovum pacificum]TNY33221.1 helix-turn-helix transcriptional regulator [Pelagovum pacificum]